MIDIRNVPTETWNSKSVSEKTGAIEPRAAKTRTKEP